MVFKYVVIILIKSIFFFILSEIIVRDYNFGALFFFWFVLEL